MPEQRSTRFETSFEEITAGLEDLVVPPTVLARWAAMAGQRGAVGVLPTQPSAA